MNMWGSIAWSVSLLAIASIFIGISFSPFPTNVDSEAIKACLEKGWEPTVKTTSDMASFVCKERTDG